MNKPFLFVCAAALSLTSTLSTATTALDPRILGSWEGMREQNPDCRFLAWNSTFTADGRFEINFFADKDRLKPMHTQRGTWKASNGRSEITTEGVQTPEVYLYDVIGENSIHYVNTVKDPSADCQVDYEFTEYRVKP